MSKITDIKETWNGKTYSEVEEFIKDELERKALRAENPTNGNLAALDEDGNIVDSGHSTDDFLTPQQVKTVNGIPIAGAGNIDIPRGEDAVNPFKGWIPSETDLQELFPLPAVGDYAYVRGAEPTDPARIYECTVAGTWSDSGRVVDTSNITTFESGEPINQVSIINDLKTGGEHNVLSAEQGKILDEKIEDNCYVNEEQELEFSLPDNTGSYKPNGTMVAATNGYSHSGLIDISDFTRLNLYINVGSISVSPCVFFDSDNNFISGITALGTEYHDYYIQIPSGAKYCIISTKMSSNPNGVSLIGINHIGINQSVADSSKFLTGEQLNQVSIINDLETGGEHNVLSAEQGKILDEKIEDNCYVNEEQELEFSFSPNSGAYRPNGGMVSAINGYDHTDLIDITGFNYLRLYINTGSIAVSPCVFFDSDTTFISGITAPDTEYHTYYIQIPSGAKYCILSEKANSNPNGVSLTGIKRVPIKSVFGKSDFCYLSLNGNDTNSGLSPEFAIATINRAKEITSNTLYLLDGEYNNLNLDFSDFDTIIGIGEVQLLRYNNKITSASLVTGKIRTYQASYDGNIEGYSSVWQHNIPDETTLISPSERHPLHEDRIYRLPSRRLYRASSIEEIDTTLDKLMFYTDPVNHIIYFSKSDNSDLATNPIIIPALNNNYKATKQKNVQIKNISIKYAGLKTKNLTGTLIHCSVGMCHSQGAFQLDDTQNLVLIQCEGYAAEVSTGGDGFNTHTSNGYQYSRIEMYDCWAHDNRDDGESCHEHSFVTQHGGLFEYNGSGCTPASGGHAEYYNVLCRHNKNWDWVFAESVRTGFSAQGKQTIGNTDVYSTIICWNCVAEDSPVGFRDTSNQNKGSVCYNCITINCSVPYQGVSVFPS